MGAGVFLIGDIALLIVSDKAGQHYTEPLLTGDNQSSHKQTKTSQYLHTSTPPTQLPCHHHPCSASAPPRAPARAQLGCDYRQSFLLVSPWSHSHHQREDHNLGSCFLLLLLLQSGVRSVNWDHVLLLLYLLAR